MAIFTCSITCTSAKGFPSISWKFCLPINHRLFSKSLCQHDLCGSKKINELNRQKKSELYKLKKNLKNKPKKQTNIIEDKLFFQKCIPVLKQHS